MSAQPLPRLEHWSVGSDIEPGSFVAPEHHARFLAGKVYGHPGRHHDGKTIRTSRIVGAEGRRVSTKSGTVYELGEPEPAYRAWLAQHHPDWDPENPVKVHRCPCGAC
jgi:hypothetical protein